MDEALSVIYAIAIDFESADPAGLARNNRLLSYFVLNLKLSPERSPTQPASELFILKHIGPPGARGVWRYMEALLLTIARVHGFGHHGEKIDTGKCGGHKQST